MTNLWTCTLCHRETLSHLPLCIHCGPISQGKCLPATVGTFAPEPSRPTRTAAQILSAVKANLEMSRDLTALKLATCKPGSSSYKSTAGFLRGIQEALGVLASECGGSDGGPR